MANGDRPRGLLSHSRAVSRVMGLRDYEQPPEVIIYKANPDGSKGERIRIEPAKVFERGFNNGRSKT